jgi:hypothetical protein
MYEKETKIIIDALAEIPGEAKVNTNLPGSAAFSYAIKGTDLVILGTLGLNGTGIIAKSKDLSAPQGGFLYTHDLDEADARAIAGRVVRWYASRKTGST